MSTLIMKFGGTSTGNAEALNRAADIVIAQNGEWDRMVVVVSAMEGVTDMLIECAERALSEDKGPFQIIIDELHHKLFAVVRRVFTGDQYHQQLMSLIDTRIAELTSICQRIQIQGNASPQEMDELAALGERINVHVFSALLRKRGILSEPVEATELIVTDDCHQAASPIKTATDTRIRASLFPLFAKAIIPVVTGFIGATPNGATTTLGRGGSDYTATILAESLDADEVWIWTDVDGIMTADPRLTPRARLIPEISYNEVHQLAYFGAKVLHPKTIFPAMKGDISLWVKNTFNPQCAGTRICNRPLSGKHEVSALTGLFNVSLITVQINPGEDVAKIKTRISQALTKRGISNPVVFQAKRGRSVSFVFFAKNSSPAVQAFNIDGALKSLGRKYSQPHVTDNMTLITLVGREISRFPQVLSIVSNTLEQAGVDINLIGNGTSPDSLVFAVANKDGEHAIKQIHDDVILNETLISPKTQPVLGNLSAI
jgi:aspartate kinase